MADSIVINVLIPAGLSGTEFEHCNFPAANQGDEPAASADFKVIKTVSPLTGAGFVITPLGLPIPGRAGERFKYGRIAGYQVSANIPACLAGHNRQLVNGVRQAGRAAILLLKSWLAENGCTAEGISYITPENASIASVTLTYLFEYNTQEQAREVLHEFREHSETVLNTSKSDESNKNRRSAYSYPARPDPDQPLYSYTSYIRMREFKIAAYVKERDQPGAFLLPIQDEVVEALSQARSEATLRVEVMLHGKWLKEHQLSALDDWVANPEAYRRVFGLVRGVLRLDAEIRTKRLKKSTVEGLSLSRREKSYLLAHLDGMCLREAHSDAREMEPRSWCKTYSAARRKIFSVTGIDLDIPYAGHTRRLAPGLSEKLKYRGEYRPPAGWAEHMFSQASVPNQVEKLTWYVEQRLSGSDDVPTFPLRDAWGQGSRCDDYNV
ncbi:hypothetical protein [Achromobacter xylosoxidans]|uniref:hypothetical protein n=1 Tax=Alcaligenes xylosoxydans xylosoxydans TaxID=85698 RepID=UPI001EEA949D|nr:hypothetical protein [Achromobacter xylosoxidans]